MVRVAIDAMGGDFGCTPLIAGAVEALKAKSFKPILVGDEEQIVKHLPETLLSQITIEHATSVISMHDHATDALKRKDSSIYIASELVRAKKADALVSAGHSGATMSLATLRVGRIKNVQRPAIATILPNLRDGKTILLDVGANVDSKPEHLFQFGVMGIAYAKSVFGQKNVKVGLLANGEEEGKGNEVTKEALRLLKELPEFVGYVESSAIFDGSVNVIVTDGFVGNVVLKTCEAVADTIGKFMKNNIKDSTFASFGSLFLQKVFSKLKQQIDYAEYGGAPLLGIDGCVVIAHGKSNAKAMKNAILQGINFVESGINSRIESNLKI